MKHRTLIVAKLRPRDADRVAEAFARSDAGPLPGLVGVTHRSLFRFDPDLYFHYIEADADVAVAVDQVRATELYQDLNRELATYISALHADTWRSPRDAMAHEFYRWTA